jgi:hypothetical protein
MTWILAHRPADAAESTTVERGEASSADAIEAVRSSIPEGHKILFVMRK